MENNKKFELGDEALDAVAGGCNDSDSCKDIHVGSHVRMLNQCLDCEKYCDRPCGTVKGFGRGILVEFDCGKTTYHVPYGYCELV